MKKDSLSDLERFIETIKKLISIKEIIIKSDKDLTKKDNSTD